METATAFALTVAVPAALVLACDAASALPRLAAAWPRLPWSAAVRGLVVAATVLAALGRAPARAATPPPMLRIDRPLAAGPPASAERSPAQVRGGDVYLVRPGDTLWGIAARTLQDRQGGVPDGAAVDAFWRRIYAENHAVVGADPDLIFPGQQLVVPPGA